MTVMVEGPAVEVMPYRNLQLRIEVAKRFVAKERLRPCKCGKVPVEWHGEHHQLPGQHKRRIAQMAARGRSVEDICSEMARCERKCRGCHMKEDGRAAAGAERFKTQGHRFTSEEVRALWLRMAFKRSRPRVISDTGHLKG